MYAFDARVRYSETDSQGKLTINSIINYFQDCSIFHSEDLGLGLSYLEERHMVWVLSSWHIVIHRYPEMGEHIRVATAPYQFKGFLGFRNFALIGQDGTQLAIANTMWTLLDTNTWKPTAAPAEMIEGYQVEERWPMDYTGRRIKAPQQGQALEPIVVKKHHIDTNQHVNNGQYVAIAMELLPEQYEIQELRVEYKSQAVLEDVLYPVLEETESSIVVALMDENQKPYATLEFVGRRKNKC